MRVRTLGVARRVWWPAGLAVLVLLSVVLTAPGSDRGRGAAPAEPPTGDMPMIAVPAAAMQATTPRLDRTGWTATASDQETAGEPGQAANVLDGDVATIWHSRWSSNPPPLPHTITIDMRTPVAVSALTYLPRPGGGNGTIGRYEVRLSTDGASFGNPVAAGTWADDASEKTAAFTAGTARYVRLTGVSEAGGRGTWSSAAEIGMRGVAAPDGVLPRTGWTAQASDAETAVGGYPASAALDGVAATFWHSRWSGTPAPLPHTVTITMPAAVSVSGLRYLPRADNANGRVGGYRVETSTDGATYRAVASGTFADDATEKTATFPRTAARFVRLVVTGEAGNRGPWASAAEINLLGTATIGGPDAVGSWGPTIGFPLVPSSAALLPNNKVLLWSGVSATTYGMGSPGQTQVAVLDLATGRVSGRTVVVTGHEMFCTGIATLPDGRIMITGGSSAAKSTIYNPADDTWTAGPPLNIPRGYQSDVTLSTGQIFTLGGSWSGGRGGKDGELFTPNGTWTRLPGVTADRIVTRDADPSFRADNHGWFFAIDDGRVFHAGPSTQMNWITTTGAGSITPAGTRTGDTDAMNGTAVLYDVGKIFTSGGSPSYQNSEATRNAFTIDISGGPATAPRVTRLGPMASARAFGNGVVLPDGKVLVVGGQAHAAPFTDTTAAMNPELWDPATGGFTTMAGMAVPRTYHSVALLLPDGRVLSGGGGLCGTCATNHLDGQIFTPPYLLNADGTPRARPTITAAPATARPNSSITVRTGAAVRSFALVRVGTATHTVDTDQRRIPLAAGTRSGGAYSLRIPPGTGTVVPGNYMLFALDAAGTPSVARVINIR